MTVPLTGSGGFFTRQGAIIGEFNRVAAQYGSPLTNGFQSIWAQFASSDQAAVQNLPQAVAQYAQSGAAYLQTLQQDGSQSILLQTSDYYSVIPYTSQEALLLIAAQMTSTAQSIQKPTLSAVITPSVYGTNYSDAILAVGFLGPFGVQLDNSIGETIQITCTQPSPLYQETLNAVGQAQQPAGSATWPGGSGCNYTFSISDPNTNGLVTDGGFQSWGGTGNNTPLNWTVVNGATGVTVFRGTPGAVGRTPYAFQITSDGSSLTAAQQTLTLQPNTVYAVKVSAKVSATDGAGTMIMSLVDENGNVINDSAGNGNTQSFTMSSATPSATNVGTTYASFTYFFRTPRQLPVSVGVRIGYGVAPAATKSLYLSMVGFVAPGQPYYPGPAGGPFIAAFANNNGTALGDNWGAAISTSETPESFAFGFLRLYNTAQLGVLIPSSLSPTIPDNLILH